MPAAEFAAGKAPVLMIAGVLRETLAPAIGLAAVAEAALPLRNEETAFAREDKPENPDPPTWAEVGLVPAPTPSDATPDVPDDVPAGLIEAGISTDAPLGDGNMAPGSPDPLLGSTPVPAVLPALTPSVGTGMAADPRPATAPLDMPMVTGRPPPLARIGLAGDDVIPGAAHCAAADASWDKASTATSINSLSIDTSPLTVISWMMASSDEFVRDSTRACLLVGAAMVPATKQAVAVSWTKRIASTA